MDRVILVTGATGQQGGATAARLLGDGWRVRALTRDVTAPPAVALAEQGAELVAGDLADRTSLDEAVRGAYGVFSVQPGVLSGGTPEGFDSEVEARWGRHLAEAALDAGVRHLVHSSVARAEDSAGIGVFEAKWQVERHIRAIGQPATILRPVSFMENYAHPAWGVPAGALISALRPDTVEQLVAVDDIGAFAALAFADPHGTIGRTIDIAGDALTPVEIAAAISRVTVRTIPYRQIPIEAIRRQNPAAARAFDFLNDEGGYQVDIAAVRSVHPGLLDFDAWLDRHGRKLFDNLG
ncbi:NmrA/HSCARG family protein [Dactylosporangium sp. McL0621]|uniref:NmrA/HSCARG family protein n=1 Tax=Dactylosporangium sp. McL0621 TaxID=3415678 RepID=UPI003CE9491F